MNFIGTYVARCTPFQDCRRFLSAFRLTTLLAGGLLLLCSDSARAASVIEEISFESGSVGPAGSPATTGWQWDPDAKPEIVSIETVHASRPNFDNGTNQEALVLHPIIPEGVGFSPTHQGVVWEKQFDASEDPNEPNEVLDAGEVFYMYFEFFGDTARGNQTYKTNFYFGKLGNGTSGEGGFSTGPGEAFDDTNGVQEAGWTWGENDGGNDDESNCSCGILGSGTAGLFVETRYGSPVTSADLDQNHIGIMLLRQGVDAATAFTGSEMELSESNGNFNGGDATNADPNFHWGGNTTIITGTEFDKVTTNFRRPHFVNPPSNSTFANWVDPDPNNCGSSPSSCLYDTQIGVKYMRFGTADITDINLDGTTDAADEAIVTANLGLYGPLDGDFDGDFDVDGGDFLLWQRGLSPTPNSASDLADWESNYGSTSLGNATFFDGDVNNDLFVDAADQALFPLQAASAVPEPSAALLILMGFFSWEWLRSGRDATGRCALL